MMSRWPSLVSMPTVAPFLSNRAFVATVVPCTIKVVSARRRRRSSESSLASRSRPSMTPSEGSAGVDADLASVTRPASSTATRSVKVPRTSIPTRNMSADRPVDAVPLSLRAGPSTPLDRDRTVAPTGVVSLAATGGAGALHESVLPIDGARLRVALPRIAIAPAPGRVDEEHRPRQDGDADLLGLERASAPLGNHPVAMGKPVPTAEDAVGGMARPVPGGIAPGWLRGLHAQLEDRAHATPETAIASGSGPEFVTREEKGEAGLRDLDAAELDSACCLALAGGLPAIADRRSATATTGVEEMPDELALR